MQQSARNPRRLLAAAATLAGGLTLLAAPAHASHAGDANDALAYHAQFEAQSPNLRLESGQVATSWMDATNVSATTTWNRSTVRLATLAAGRESALAIPGDWINAARPTPLEQATVGPGAKGRFAFRVRAPLVATETTYKEEFGPVAEGAYWMNQAEWGTRAITYTVTPPTPPTVSLINTPVRVRSGETVALAASVRDDYKVRSVKFGLGPVVVDATTPNPAAPDTYFAAMPTTGLPPGLQTVTVSAVDHVGNERVVTHQLEVFEPLPAPVAPSISASAQLRARVLSRGRGIRVLGLTIKAPTGSRVTVYCRPKGCKSQTIGATKRSTTRPGKTKNRTLRRRAKLYVRITKPGMTGKLIRFTVGKRNVSKAEYAVPVGQ